jgi:hypothetical protein
MHFKFVNSLLSYQNIILFSKHLQLFFFEIKLSIKKDSSSIGVFSKKQY